jgi:hypothetical protein
MMCLRGTDSGDQAIVQVSLNEKAYTQMTVAK